MTRTCDPWFRKPNLALSAVPRRSSFSQEVPILIELLAPQCYYVPRHTPTFRGATQVPKTELSDAGLRSFQTPEKGTVDYWDTKLPSFGCRVSQGGAKTFILKLDNSRRAIGRYPIISLSEARTEAKRLLAEKTLGKVRPQSITFPAALELFLAEKGKARKASTVKDLAFRLNRHFPFKGQLADVNHQDVARRLARLSSSSEHNQALRVAKTFFTWAVARRYRTDNPVTGLSTRTTHSRSRVLSDLELKLIWKACSLESATREDAGGASFEAVDTKLPRAYATIVKLLMLTGQRRNEIASLRSDYISNDTICLPKELTKNGREHTFPIGTLFKSTLTTVTEHTSAYIFPARGKPHSPFNGWSKSKVLLDKLSGIYDWTLHDLRRTFATRLAELGIAPHLIERLLNHVSGQISGVSAIYNRATYFPDMRAAIARWDLYLIERVVRC